jgi:predicted secreted hydrolase
MIAWRFFMVGWFCLMALGVFADGMEKEFSQADPTRVMSFPRDHGKHPDFQTEWWYFTGNLTARDREFGFQLTFFRRSLFTKRVNLASNWAAKDLYPAHFAITDKTGKRFFHFEAMSREGPNLAGASDNDLDVSVGSWSARGAGDSIVLAAAAEGVELKLTLRPAKAMVLQGQNGYSRKGDSENQASHYYSFTRLSAQGAVTIGEESYSVEGLAWMDHEFGSSILSSDQAGWDWFSLQLDDGSEVMVFHLRKKDGTFEKPFGTLVTANGVAKYLSGDQISIVANRTWKSPKTGAAYPAAWTIRLKDSNARLEVVPSMEDQELSAKKSTQVVYWEGAVQIQGISQGVPVRGSGYAELTGYAHSMGGRL